MIGRVISGRYVIQAIVGTGGMAVVYRAFDQKKNRIVAIKVLRPEYESDEEFVRRFSREAEAASKVSHENIVNMLDVGIDGDMRYIVMEYVDGQT
ncbi:MAG: protein kinase, partial [Clostridia bacterium]|nr:protein kinase [Clostridia bacterium]